MILIIKAVLGLILYVWFANFVVYPPNQIDQTGGPEDEEL